MAKILIGTSGYHYTDWIGTLYPPGTKKDDFLTLYAKEFPTLELNFSYYKMPEAGQLQRMMDEGPNLTFSIKAHETLTHKIDASKWKDEAKTYLKAIEPLQKEGRLEAVLFQFPYSFHYTPEKRQYLDNLLEEFSAAPNVVEFRNGEWSCESVIEGLKKRSAALASVDEPKLKGLPPVLDAATGSLAYFRFHGRNNEKWWGSDSRARYDYLYSEDELMGITGRLKGLAEKAHKLLIYFNNHAYGKAVLNARALKIILEKVFK